MQSSVTQNGLQLQSISTLQFVQKFCKWSQIKRRSQGDQVNKHQNSTKHCTSEFWSKSHEISMLLNLEGFFFPQTCKSNPAILWLLTVLLSIYFIQTQVLSLNIIQTRHLITKVSSVFKELLKEERKKANESLGRSCTLHKLVQGRKWIGNPIRLWARLCTVAIWEP